MATIDIIQWVAIVIVFLIAASRGSLHERLNKLESQVGELDSKEDELDSKVDELDSRLIDLED